MYNTWSPSVEAREVWTILRCTPFFVTHGCRRHYQWMIPIIKVCIPLSYNVKIMCNTTYTVSIRWSWLREFFVTRIILTYKLKELLHFYSVNFTNTYIWFHAFKMHTCWRLNICWRLCCLPVWTAFCWLREVACFRAPLLVILPVCWPPSSVLLCRLPTAMSYVKVNHVHSTHMQQRILGSR